MSEWHPYNKHKRLAYTGEKVRNVIVVIYVEDLERAGKTYYDLLGYLDHRHVPACVSPIHDHDVWSSEDVLDWCTQRLDDQTGDLDERYIGDAPYVGKPKKPHVHVLIKLDSQQTAQWFTSLMEDLVYIRPTMWDKPTSVASCMRYWAHMDSPTKYRYSEWDIVGIGGIDLSPLTKRDDRTNEDLANAVYAMLSNSSCRYFFELLDMAYGSGDAELVSYIRGTHALWRGYLHSKAQQAKDKAYIDKLDAERRKAQAGM